MRWPWGSWPDTPSEPILELLTVTDLGGGILPRQERSSQTRNHGTTPPCGRELPPGRTRKGEVDSDSLFRVFRWIPWLISDSSGAAIGCCWTESAVRICADLGCRGNRDECRIRRGVPPRSGRHGDSHRQASARQCVPHLALGGPRRLASLTASSESSARSDSGPRGKPNRNQLCAR